MSMEDLAKAAAEQMGIPESMVMRSARAKAKAQGVAVEDVLAAWAGGGEITPGSGGGAAAPAGEAAEAAPAPEEPSGPQVEVLGPEEAAPAESAETEVEPEVVEEETEIDPISAGVLPRWLVALFIVIPTVAVAYALFLPNGPNCGDGGQLAVDPVTGVAVNCDGSQYGVDVVDFFAIGETTYASCTACHGANGQGGANFPAFIGGALLQTFPVGQCDEHVAWVELGTVNWPDETYGANNKPVGGSGAVMPGFASLSEDELRSVVLYERVQFGGQSLDEALADCGLADPAVEAMGE